MRRAITRSTRIGSSAPSTGAYGTGLSERTYTAAVLLKGLFWGSLGALAWTHVAYPAAAELAARAADAAGAEGRGGRADGDRDHPRLQRGAGDRAPAREPARARLPAREARDRRRLRRVERPHQRARRGSRRARAAGAACSSARAAARSRRRTGPSGRRRSDVVAFSDGNATWAPDALRQLVANLADPEVAYVCGQLRLQDAAGTNREGTYWRYEMKLRDAESRLGSITGGNGSIYAVKRADYIEVDPRWGHDLSFPYRMVQEGRRAVYEPQAHAFEKPTPSNETEYRRKVRMFEHCWEITLRGSMFRRLPPGYLVEIVSHRLLRYGSGILHLTLLASSIALVGDGWAYGIVLAGQVALIAAAAAGVPIARYYALVTWATVVALWNYLRRGVPATWEAAEGTR